MNEDLRGFIVEFSGVKNDELKPEARIVNDLGIDGDDGDELIIAYGKKFNVDVSKFMVADYFSPEGDSLLLALIRLVTGKTKPIIKALTIAHLEKGIVSGELNEDVINK